MANRDNRRRATDWGTRSRGNQLYVAPQLNFDGTQKRSSRSYLLSPGMTQLVELRVPNFRRLILETAGATQLRTAYYSLLEQMPVTQCCQYKSEYHWAMARGASRLPDHPLDERGVPRSVASDRAVRPDTMERSP